MTPFATPAPFYTPETFLDTKVSIGSKSLGLKLGLVFGTSGPKKNGRVVGFGVGNKSGARYQMWRMDYHLQHQGRGGGREMAWDDGAKPNYNFHVNYSP